MRHLSISAETWPLKNHFTIARGKRTEINTVTVLLEEDGLAGRGECFPHSRYSESVESVMEQIAALRHSLEAGISRFDLLSEMPAGAARNAVDCALWDLEIKKARRKDSTITAWQVAGLAQAPKLTTVMTISMDAPEVMASAATKAVTKGYRNLKIKLGSADWHDDIRIEKIRAAAPKAVLVVDANEGWTPETLTKYLPALAAAGVAMLEQPLLVGGDDMLANLKSPIPIGADESCHTRADLAGLVDKYDVVNIKLDKAGGLTEALATARQAREMGFEVMVGCMLGTSLATAPATLVASLASYVDLDGPLWLVGDREHPLSFAYGAMSAVHPKLWG